MEAYTDDVVAGFSTEVSTFTSTVYPVIGIQIGNQKFKGVNVEALLPSFFLSGGNFSLIETERYSGFRISYQLPIGQ